MTDLIMKPETTETLSHASAKSRGHTSAKSTGNKKKTHPPTSEMVTTAIKEMNERRGSSLQAIKKFIYVTYAVDIDKISIYIRKFLKSAVETGELIQTRGSGASGSFKLGNNKTKIENFTNTSSKTLKSTAKKILEIINNKRSEKKLVEKLSKLAKSRKSATSLGKKSVLKKKSTK